eukprot:TRINITY_DN2415_c0_g2_i1.p2 TRINITY_DN2415_c0_g2~~TRINITY_DN2415_c0_g2_i1.p2  ORF type:complete len:174 (-),score=23.92 TRINITY_DN2415_c0_g2_i1:1806-2288(-)
MSTKKPKQSKFKKKQIHWVMLYALGFMFISTFLIFETGINNPKEVKYIFSILCGVCTSVILVLQDLGDPMGGMYTFRDNLEGRLQFVCKQLDNLLGNAPVPITSGIISDKEQQTDKEESEQKDKEEEDSNVGVGDRKHNSNNGYVEQNEQEQKSESQPTR